MSDLTIIHPPGPPSTNEALLADLTDAQRQAVCFKGGPLLIIAGAGTGKTTVIARRIAWLIQTRQARAEEILALTFSDKAAVEMEERVDLLVPYGYVEMNIRTFHAFGDQLLREHALKLGFSPHLRVLSQAEQIVFLRQYLFDLPLECLRPLYDPTKFLEALIRVFSRAKDEAVGPEGFLGYVESLTQQAEAASLDLPLQLKTRRLTEVARCYASYQQRLREHDAVDFGDQVFLTIQLLEHHPDVVSAIRERFRYILVDEFQDTNFAQFKLLQLLAPPASSVTVVGDDDQSIYKWRGAAISNVLKFLEHYSSVHTIVLTDNFRSTQPILDCAYRLIRSNDPDRLEAHRAISKRLIARANTALNSPHWYVFDTVSSEADWVARTIREAIGSAGRHPKDFAILVRSNREADPFLRSLNVAGIPWQFSGSSGLFAREESKLLLSCLKTLADPENSLSWYHVASSRLYRCPMRDLMKVLAEANQTHRSFRHIAEHMEGALELQESLSEIGRSTLAQLLSDVERLSELSRTHSAGQLLYRWLKDRGLLSELGSTEDHREAAALQTVARFFDYLRRVEELGGSSLVEVMQHLELFQALGNEPIEEEDAWTDAVRVLTIHKAKGLEFPVVFLVGLVQGRFPTPKRHDPIELPDALVKDLLPTGDYHLQEERRLFYVGMTRAKEVLYLTAAYDYGGKTKRKISQFVHEALDLSSPSPPARRSSAKELIERSQVPHPLLPSARLSQKRYLRLDPHGVDDYLTCPLKYRYSHVLKIPLMRHHLVVYGGALHKAIEQFFERRLQNSVMDEVELLQVFEDHWKSEGFLTREHETLRLAQGKEVLKRFHASQKRSPEEPTFIEEKFRFPLEDMLVVGRWDRVDLRGDDAVIIDYKSSDVREEREANRRTQESIQMLIYALAWRVLHGYLPLRVELHFLESGVVGQAHFTEEDMDQARQILHRAAQGIRSEAFSAKPQEHTCRWCAFQSICPFAFRVD